MIPVNKEKYTAFWQNEGMILYLRTPSVMPQGKNLDEKWMDTSFRAENEAKEIRKATFFADAFPSVFTNFGPGSLAAYIGGGFSLSEDTVWFEENPIIKDYNEMPTLSLNEDAPLWQATLSLTQKLFEKESFFPSMTDLGGTMDIAASLRGTQTLLFDLYDYPDEVEALCNRIRTLWKEVYNRLSSYLLSRGEGMTSWMPIWCPGRYSPIQCDFSAMLSPEMFERFALPDLKNLVDFLDYSVYHLDGVGELPHLKNILSIPKLNAVQWTAGAGQPDVVAPCWFDLYDQIQAAGKSLCLFTDHPEEAEPLLRHLKPKGVYLYSDKATPEIARDLEKIIKEK